MLLTEYDEARAMELFKEDGRRETRVCVATDMLQEKMSMSLIEKISHLSADTIHDIAKANNLPVVET